MPRAILPAVLPLLLFMLLLVRPCSAQVSGQERKANPPVDPASGLIMDDNWEVVRAHCGACHSTRLVTQNRGSRETWLRLIRWMQDSQGLWPLNGPTEQALLDYLEQNYGPAPATRRKPLPVELRPAR
jgi:hypothetical protein